MFRKKIVASFLVFLMLFGCSSAQSIKANNKFLAPTSLIVSGEVEPVFIGNYISDKLIGYTGKALFDEAAKLLEKFFPGSSIIESFPYPHAVIAAKTEINGEKQVVVVSKKSLDTYAKFYRASKSLVGVTFLTEKEFNTNIEFLGSTNQVSKVRISRPLVYKEDALEKFSYVIPKTEADREVTKFVIGVQKAKEFIQADANVKLSNRLIEEYVDEVVIKTGQGSAEFGPKVFKNVYSVMLDVLKNKEGVYSEEEFKDMTKFIHIVANSFTNIYIDQKDVAKEVMHCNTAFKDKKTFFNKVAEENPEYMSMPFLLEDVRKRVETAIEKYHINFEYALYCVFKHSYLIDDPMFTKNLEGLRAVMPHVMKDLELSVDYMISKASKFIGSLNPSEISDKLKKEEYAACSRVIDKVTTDLTMKMNSQLISYAEADNAFKFVEHVREQLNQILEYGYKGAYLAGVEIETNLEKLFDIKSDLKKSDGDVAKIAEIDKQIDLFEDIGNTIITDILEVTEFSFDAPEEGFILFVDDMDAYVFNKFLEKYDNTKIRGIVAKKGTSTSHWVITAGQKDIPVILGPSQVYGAPKKDIFAAVEKSGHVAIDGNTGALITNLDGDKLRDWIEEKNWSDSASEYFNGRVYEDTKLHLPIAINFDADLNVSSISPFEIDRALNLAVSPLFKKYNVDKIGLVRTEYLYMMERMLNDKEMMAFYKFMSSPEFTATIRGFDYEADKDISAVDKLYLERGETKPQNVFGAKYYYQDPTGIGRELIKKQLTYVYKAFMLRQNSKLRFMFPMVSSQEDIDEVMKIKNEVIAELSQDEDFRESLFKYYNGDSFYPGDVVELAGKMEIGCMVETVLAVRNLDKINKAFDFTSIGTNDLTKSTFDVSRDDPNAKQYFTMLQPDLLKEIKEIFDSAVKHKKPVSVCGELAKDSKFMLFVLAESAKHKNPEETFFPYVNLSMSAVNTPQSKELLRTIAQNSDIMAKVSTLFAGLDNINANDLDRKAADIYASLRHIILDSEAVSSLRESIESDFFVRHPDLSDFMRRHQVEDAFAMAA